MNPLSTSRNKYHLKPKDSSIYTPPGVCEFLQELVHPHLRNNVISGKLVVDPSIGSGNLVEPFGRRGYKILGYDINDDPNRTPVEAFYHENFLQAEEKRDDVGLVICNPPFNTDQRNKDWLKKNKKGKALLPELFAEKVFELYGKDVPYIMICPMGTLLNQRLYDKEPKKKCEPKLNRDGRIISDQKGTRYRKMRDTFPQITSIVSLPLDIFPNVEFHNLILIFNMPQLKPHYFLPEKYV